MMRSRWIELGLASFLVACCPGPPPAQQAGYGPSPGAPPPGYPPPPPQPVAAPTANAPSAAKPPLQLAVTAATGLPAPPPTRATGAPVPPAAPTASAPPAAKPPATDAPAVAAGNPKGHEAGQSCSSSKECKSGVCEGQGCGYQAGKCAPANRMCTRDLVAYCSCSGQTFGASGTCPGRLYRHKGPCK